MKQVFLSLAGALVFLSTFTACTEEVESFSSNELREVIASADNFIPEVDSRAFSFVNNEVAFSWADGDTIGIFPNEGAQAYFPILVGSEDSNSASFTGGGWALKASSTYASYYPFIGDFYMKQTEIPVSYVGQKQSGNASMAHLSAFDYMAASASTPSSGRVNFNFKHLGAFVQLKITMPQGGTLSSVTLSADEAVFVTEGKVDLTAATPTIQAVTKSKTLTLDVEGVTTTAENPVATLYMMLAPVNMNGKTLNAIVKQSNGATETILLTSKNFEKGKAYGVTGATATNNGTYTDGVVSITNAGYLESILGSDYLNITSLKIVGPINGTDVRCLRQMLGGNDYEETEWGKLAILDLSEATIVEGGDTYYNIGGKYSTSNYRIGSYMFHKCANLQSIVLPDNTTFIGERAFQNCDAMTSIAIGDDVTKIAGYAFYDCDALNTIYMGSKVSDIMDYAFQYCEAIESVYINDLSAWCKIDFLYFRYNTPLYYGANLYLNNQELTELTIPEDITKIEGDCFYGCKSLINVEIPEHVTSIGGYTFYGCSSLSSVTIGDGVTSIDGYTFYGCSSLSSVTIGDGVTSIGYYAFYGCSSLSSVTIPDDVTSIGRYAFYGCSSLASVTIPEGVTSIGEYTFYGCSSLSSVTIGDGVTSIGYYAFEDCDALTSVYISDLSSWCKIDFGSKFDNSNPLYYGAKLYLNGELLTELVIPEEVTKIEDCAFNGCSSIEKITIHDDVTYLGSYAFSDCSSLTSVTIGNGVTSISSSAFDRCGALTSITIPKSVTSIESWAFQDCDALTSVYISDLSAWCRIDFTYWSSNPLYYGAKLYLNGDLLTELIIPEEVTEIKGYAFYGCSSIEKITIHDGVTSLSFKAFTDCSSLTSVTIGNGITSIGSDAFSYCSSLTSVTIGDGVTMIFSEAFRNCSSLTSVTIPNSVTSIGYWAFCDCYALNEIYCYATTPPTCDSYDVFYDCNLNNAILYVPKGCKSVYESATVWNRFAYIIEMD